MITGPSEAHIKHYCQNVFVILTDDGAEAGISKAKDCVRRFLEAGVDEEALETEAPLFPNSIHCLDVNHLWDWVLHTAGEACS